MAALVVCVLQALSGVAAVLDGGFVSGEPDASLAPATNAPENTMSSRAERRRFRRLKRLGGEPTLENGPAVDGGAGGAPRDAGPVRIAAREAYDTFLTALDSIGLTVEQGPGYLKIIETSKAKSSSLPVYGFDGRRTDQKARRTKQTDAGN